MIKKSTLVMLFFMLLSVAAFLILKNNESLDFLAMDEEPTPTSLPTFISLDPEAIKKFTINEKGQNEVIITKGENDEWYISAEEGIITDGNINQIISVLNAIEAFVTLKNDFEEKIYGLDDPAYIFSIEMIDGSKYQIIIGDENPTKTGYYAKVDTNLIMVIPHGGINTIVEILRSAQTPTTPPPNINSTPEN